LHISKIVSIFAALKKNKNNYNMEKVIKSYKGFDKDLKCRGFQYEIGKEYEQNGNIIVCENGFHACENPFDVLDYYGNFLEDRYCEVEQFGKLDGNGCKNASSKIKIKAEIGFVGIFKAGIEWLKELTNPQLLITDKKEKTITSDDSHAKIGSSGNYAQIGSSGNCAQIGSSGNYAKIGSSGYGAQIGSSGSCAQIGSSGNYAKINSTGENSVICCAGGSSMVKAAKGSWITLSEWVFNDDNGRYIPKCVKTEYVDGDRIKADAWYKLVNGEFKEIQL
jgi:hypothetical protein